MKKIVRKELINSMFDFMMTVFGGISAPPSKLIVGQAYANLVEEIILFIHTIELVLSCLVIDCLLKYHFLELAVMREVATIMGNKFPNMFQIKGSEGEENLL